MNEWEVVMLCMNKETKCNLKPEIYLVQLGNGNRNLEFIAWQLGKEDGRPGQYD